MKFSHNAVLPDQLWMSMVWKGATEKKNTAYHCILCCVYVTLENENDKA